MLGSTTWLLIGWMAAAARPKSADALNRRGFVAYEKGDLATAHRLFEHATAADSRHAFAWLNLARTTVLRAAGKEPDDPCALERSWVYLAIAHLERAVALDAPAVRAKIDADTRGLAALKQRPEFAAWSLALQPLPVDDGALRGFIAAHGFSWASMGVIHGLTLGKDGQALWGPTNSWLAPAPGRARAAWAVDPALTSSRMTHRADGPRELRARLNEVLP